MKFGYDYKARLGSNDFRSLKAITNIQTVDQPPIYVGVCLHVSIDIHRSVIGFFLQNREFSARREKGVKLKKTQRMSSVSFVEQRQFSP